MLDETDVGPRHQTIKTTSPTVDTIEISPPRSILRSGKFWLVAISAVLLIGWGITPYVYEGAKLAGIRRNILANSLFVALPLAWITADWLRKLAMPDVFLGRGFWDTVGQRIFWKIGPQCMSVLMVLVAYSMYLKENPKDIEGKTQAVSPHGTKANSAFTPPSSPAPSTSNEREINVNKEAAAGVGLEKKNRQIGEGVEDSILTPPELARLASFALEYGKATFVGPLNAKNLGLTQFGSKPSIKMLSLSANDGIDHMFAALDAGPWYIFGRFTDEGETLVMVDANCEPDTSIVNVGDKNTSSLSADEARMILQLETPLWRQKLLEGPSGWQQN